MKLLKALAAFAVATALSACASGDIPSRDAPLELIQPSVAFTETENGDIGLRNVGRSYSVERVVVDVPRSLKVSEANKYYPRGDIVWREDPVGDRYSQVKAIFDEAMARGTTGAEGQIPVNLGVRVMRFHALTEKTRYTIGGIHSIRFELSVFHAETGLLLEQPRVIQADLIGFGGQRAINAIAVGQTQKVRITDHLANVIRTELNSPEGYVSQRLGVGQLINNTL